MTDKHESNIMVMHRLFANQILSKIMMVQCADELSLFYSDIRVSQSFTIIKSVDKVHSRNLLSSKQFLFYFLCFLGIKILSKEEYIAI